MARFEDFTQQEKRVIREAMTWAQSEFYDPGHTQADRDTLRAMIREIEDADLPFTFGAEPVKVVVGVPAPAKPERIIIEATAEKAAGADQDTTQAAAERREGLLPTRPSRPYSKPTEAAAGGRGETGFLIIKCSHCGDVHAFCAKQPITVYRCEKCGGHTPLTDMSPLRIMCECGSKYNYRTNITENQMDVNCYRCGCPVAVEWVERRGRYEPIGWGDRKRGRRKK